MPAARSHIEYALEWMSGTLGGGVAGAARKVEHRAHDAARVSRFLRGHLEFTARPDDIFISSYPRSGTTWMQQVLLVLSRDGDPAAAHIAETVPWFERSLALGECRAASFEAMGSPRIFKSHLPLAWLPRRARYVYAVRDGRDVAVSYFHLYRSHLGYRGSFDDFFERFVAGDLQYRSWFKHLAGWRTAASRSDVLIVRYEDMLADLPAVMGVVNEFCGFRHSQERVGALARYCTFDYMKAHEGRFDHATAVGAAKGDRETRGSFVRRGRAGGFGEYLNEHQLATFERATAARFRYPELELDLPAFLH